MEEVRKIIEPIIKQNNYYLDNVIYEKEGGLWFLRIVIDSNNYITVDDCVKVSKLINPLLDKSGVIKGSYILDVCSKEKGNKKDE